MMKMLIFIFLPVHWQKKSDYSSLQEKHPDKIYLPEEYLLHDGESQPNQQGNCVMKKIN